MPPTRTMIERLRQRSNELETQGQHHTAAWMNLVAKQWERDLESGDLHGADVVDMDSRRAVGEGSER